MPRRTRSARRPLTLASDPQRAVSGSITDQQRAPAGGEVGLSHVERLVVAALVSAIVKELQAAQPPLRQPAA